MSLVNQGEFSLAVVVLRTGGGGRSIPYVPCSEQMQGIQRNCVALRQKASFGTVRLHCIYCHQYYVYALLHFNLHMQGWELRE